MTQLIVALTHPERRRRKSVKNLPGPREGDKPRQEPDGFDGLILQQQRVDFPASTLRSGAISYWPYILRWEDFADARAAYEKSREQVVYEAARDGEASVGALRAMQQSLDRFSSAFRQSSKAHS